MSDIRVADWVTVCGMGPYLVGDMQQEWLYLNVSGSRAYVLADWCVKVDPPWKPPQDSLWLDSDGDVWKMLAVSMQRLADPSRRSVNAAPHHVRNNYGPLVKLVPELETRDTTTVTDYTVWEDVAQEIAGGKYANYSREALLAEAVNRKRLMTETKGDVKVMSSEELIRWFEADDHDHPQQSELWEPEPGTYWLDRYRRPWDVDCDFTLRCQAEGSGHSAVDVRRDHGPMTELIQKPPVNVDDLCAVWLDGGPDLPDLGGLAKNSVESLRQRMCGVLEELRLL